MKKSDIKDMTAKDIAKSDEAQKYLMDKTKDLPADATWAQRKWHVLNPKTHIDFGKMQWTGRGYKELPVEEQVTEASISINKPIQSPEDVTDMKSTLLLSVDVPEITVEDIGKIQDVFDSVVPAQPGSNFADEAVATAAKLTMPAPKYFTEIAEYAERFATIQIMGEKMSVAIEGKEVIITSVPDHDMLLIAESDWQQKPNLCKDKLNKALGIKKGKITADSLTVRTLPVNVYRTFFDKTVFGLVNPARTAIGIYKEYDLLSAMSFDMVDQTEQSWEIINYSDKIDSNPDGSYKRAVNYFKATYFPNSIRILLDPFRDNIQLWESLGFKRTTTEYYIWEK